MEVHGEIQSKMLNLHEVLLSNSTQYHIPDFQRDFVWTNEEAMDLFQDFMEDTDNLQIETSELPGYLLGNIVLIDDNRKWTVVDGQQRLTTLSLIFKALHSVVYNKLKNDLDNASVWAQRLADLDKGYKIKNDSGEYLGLKITHEPTLSFGDYYKGIINSDDNAEPVNKIDENIDSVFQSVSDSIEELSDEQLTRFIAYIRTKVMLIVTTAPSYSKAFQLFEVLNDRGRSLEPLDLVKNLFLKQLSMENYRSEQIEEFNINWSSFIENLQISPKRVISSSTFMKHFIIAEFGENKRQNELFDFFNKDKNKDNHPRIQTADILPFSRKLLDSSKVYKEIEHNPLSNSFSKNQNMHILFKILSIKQIHPLLMKFYHSADEVKSEVLDALVRYGASIIFSYSQTNNIEKELPTIIKSILDEQLTDEEKKEIVVSQINQLIRKRKYLIESIIPTMNFANASGNIQKKATDLLRFVELYFNNNSYIITRPRGKRITIEHIMSRRLSMDLKQYGFANKEEHAEYLNRIGNLTLLFNAENSSLGNAIFKEKITAYEKSDFSVTKTIVKPIETAVKRGKEAQVVNQLNEYQPNYLTNDKTIWTKEDIHKRGENIAKLISFLVSGKKRI